MLYRARCGAYEVRVADLHDLVESVPGPVFLEDTGLAGARAPRLAGPCRHAPMFAHPMSDCKFPIVAGADVPMR